MQHQPVGIQLIPVANGNNDTCLLQEPSFLQEAGVVMGVMVPISSSGPRRVS